MRAHVETQCGFGPRVPGTAARDSAAAYIARTLESLGATVSVQTFEIKDPYGEGQLRLLNVMGSFAPKRDKRVLLGAHYDSRPRSDDEESDSLAVLPVPAAIDGAAGAGVLLEMARLVGAALPPEVGVDVVFFDGEDYGVEDDLEFYLIGSKYFVANLAGYRPQCMVLVDMIGGVGTRVAREGYSRTHSPRLTNHLFSRAGELGLDYFINVDGPPIYDDHVPFIQAGIEAANIFGYDYPHWHTTRDTPDKLDDDKVDQVGRLLTDLLYNFPF